MALAIAQGGNSHPLNTLPMTARQVLIIAIMIILNALDGFDVLSISFAAPGISEDWGITRGTLGIVLSVELVGMAIGAMTLGRAADVHGRRPIMLICLVMMATGMFLAALSTTVEILSIWRLLTGLGIGGMLAVTNAVTSEMSNAKYRSLCISLMVIGYPVGAVIGGIVVAQLLESNTWHSIFYLGGFMTALLIPVVWALVPETPAFVQARYGEAGRDRVNRILGKLNQAPVDALPNIQTGQKGSMVSEIFRGDLRRTTILLILAYFFQIITFYFILKWTPKIVSDFGFTSSSAANVLVWGNVGGAIGGVIWGLVATRMAIKPLSMATLFAAGVSIILFGTFGRDLGTLALFAAIAGFFNNAGVVAIYNLAALCFPDKLRATGTGFVIGIGRGGAVLGPVAAGFMFEAGAALSVVAAIMSLGAFIGVVMIAILKVPQPTSAKTA